MNKKGVQKPSQEVRAFVGAEVGAIKPLDKTERDTQADVQNWLESGVNIFRVEKPAVPPKHLVSYFILYDPAARSVLLVDHKKSGLWLPSGGHVEPDENPRTTVERECLEELSLPAEFMFDGPVFVTATKTVGQAQHTDVSLWYVLRGDQSAHVDWDTREFNGVRWWPLDEIGYKKDGFDPEMHRFIQKLEQLV